MAAPKFLQLVAGIPNMIAAAIVGGAGAANQIVATNASGFIDQSFLNGIGASTVTAPASEALAAGAMVNLYSNAGVLTARNADSSVTTKPATGYVQAAVASGAAATVYLAGSTDTNLSGLTPGDPYFLGSAGAVVLTAPTAAGSMAQLVGTALSATSLEFAPGSQFNN